MQNVSFQSFNIILYSVFTCTLSQGSALTFKNECPAGNKTENMVDIFNQLIF